MCKYFIIDDEDKTIHSIRKTMEDYEQFQYIGDSSDYDNAMNTVLKETPTMVFINIDSVIKSPFQFVNDAILYSSNQLEFIAISEQKNNAYDAIKLGFCDFLLSPISDLEIRKTILNFQKKKLNNKKMSICLKSYKDYQYLNTDDILFLKADNNTTEFHMNDGSTIHAYKTLKTFESILPKEFTRIHKSYIINKNYISRIQFGKSTCSIKKNLKSIPFTNTYLPAIVNINRTLAEYTYTSSIN